MDTAAFVLTLVALGLCVAAAVVSLLSARRAHVAATSGDLGELARTIERVARVQRTDTMRRVRAAAPLAQDGSYAVPPELAGAPTAPLTKQELRLKMLRGVR